MDEADPPQVWDFVLAFVELNEGPFLQTAEVHWMAPCCIAPDGIALWCINHFSQFCIVCTLAYQFGSLSSQATGGLSAT